MFSLLFFQFIYCFQITNIKHRTAPSQINSHSSGLRLLRCFKGDRHSGHLKLSFSFSLSAVLFIAPPCFQVYAAYLKFTVLHCRPFLSLFCLYNRFGIIFNNLPLYPLKLSPRRTSASTRDLSDMGGNLHGCDSRGSRSVTELTALSFHGTTLYTFYEFRFFSIWNDKPVFCPGHGNVDKGSQGFSGFLC